MTNSKNVAAGSQDGTPAPASSSEAPAEDTAGNRPATQIEHQPRGEATWVPQLAILLVCVALAMVDLSFLFEVVGEVLNMSFWPAAAVSFGIGTIGLLVMGHLGFKEADPQHRVSSATRVRDYTLWLAIGLAVAAARLLRADILHLKASDGETLVNVFGVNVAQADLVFAPIMFLMYAAAGLGAKESTHHLFANGGFNQALANLGVKSAQRRIDREKAREAQALKMGEIKKVAEARKMAYLKEQNQAAAAKAAEKKKVVRVKQEAAAIKAKLDADQRALKLTEEGHAVERRRTQADHEAELKRKADEKEAALKLDAAEVKALKSAATSEEKERRKVYFDAYRRYRQLAENFKKKYLEVADDLAGVEHQLVATGVIGETSQNLLAVISKSEESVQQQVALLLHGKTGASVAELRAVITNHMAPGTSR